MIRFLIYLLVFGGVLYFLSMWGRRNSTVETQPRPGRWFRPKRDPLETWLQVYETASIEEGRMLQARLQEEEIECILYEQGKKDIYGNSLKGIGVAVPRTSAPHAQRVISRMPS